MAVVETTPPPVSTETVGPMFIRFEILYNAMYRHIVAKIHLKGFAFAK